MYTDSAPIPPVVAPAPAPASRITPDSPFSPRGRECCRCKSSVGASDDQSCGCSHSFCKACPRLDGRGNAVLRHSFPVAWLCSTCGTTHSALEILGGREVDCACGSPTLQAVYDQFGQIYLYWRSDESVYDLRDPEKVQEAARRFLLAGGDPWMDAEASAADSVVAAAPRWNRLSYVITPPC